MWYFAGAVAATKRLLSKARDYEREQRRRLLDAYARCWKQHCKRGEDTEHDQERERRLLGTHSYTHKKRRSAGV